MPKVIGIDLGSYNSVCSVYEGNEVKIIQNSEGSYTTPSVVAFTKDGIKVGSSALRQAAMNPKNTIYNIKRLMGKKFEDVKDIISKRPYKIVDRNGLAAVEVQVWNEKESKFEDKVFTPEEISAMILQKMKTTAEDFLGEEVDKAVITVPAFFNNEEREATKSAGLIANLKIERIVNEPTAACLNVSDNNPKKYLVVDIGGSTSDFSVIDVADQVYEVLSTHGDVDLGGYLIDEAIVNWLSDEFKKDNGNVDLKKDPMALQRLNEAAEKAKIELSSSNQVDINLPYITVIDGVPRHINTILSRAKFEQMIEWFVDKCVSLGKKALELAEKKGLKNTSEIDEVLLVGGTTRVPFLQQKVEKTFKKTPNKSLNPDLCVSMGATIQGGIITGEVKDVLLLDVTPISLGIETAGGVFTKMIEANTTVPVEKSQIFSTASDNQPSVEIHVLQGERSQASLNRTLGKFHLDGISAQPRGIPQIEVTFSLDANSILTVTSKDKGTGKEQKIRIENNGSLTKEEIEKMKAEAKANEEADKKFKEEVEKLNATDSLIFQTEKSLKEFGDTIKEETKADVSVLLEKMKKAREEKNFVEIESLTKILQEKVNKFYEEIQVHQNQNQHATEPVSKSNETVDENVSDVPYEEVK